MHSKIVFARGSQSILPAKLNVLILYVTEKYSDEPNISSIAENFESSARRIDEELRRSPSSMNGAPQVDQTNWCLDLPLDAHSQISDYELELK